MRSTGTEGIEPGTAAPQRNTGRSALHPTERRRYFRVWTRLVLRHRRVEPAECERLEAELRSRAPDPPWNGDPALGSWLARIESKLDRLLDRLDPVAGRPTWGPAAAQSARPEAAQRAAGERSSNELDGADLRWVELSGSGLRFVAGDSLAPEDDVLIEIWIPGPAPRRVRSLARVVRTAEPERPGGPPTVALAFRVLAEDDRDSIVRHSLDVQRQARRRDAEDPRP